MRKGIFWRNAKSSSRDEFTTIIMFGHFCRQNFLCFALIGCPLLVFSKYRSVLFYRHLASPRFVKFRRVGRDVSSDSFDYLDPAPGLTNFGPGQSCRKVSLKHVVSQFHFSSGRLLRKETSSRSREASEGSLHYLTVNRFSCLCTCLCGCISRACRRVAFDRGALSPRFSCVWSLFCYVCWFCIYGSLLGSVWKHTKSASDIFICSKLFSRTIYIVSSFVRAGICLHRS